MKKRIGWVDIFRAICIIAIVMGHTSAKYGVYTRLFSVAAFFFISGFLTNYSKENFIDFLKNKFKSLMIPFFGINILFIILRYFLKFVGVEGILYTDSINFIYLINLFKNFATTDLGGATWFLTTLFFTNVIYKLIYDLIGKDDIKKKIYLFCVSIGICIWGYWQYYNMQQYLSYSVDLIFMALIFVASGSLFKEINKKYDKNIIINSIITILSIIGAIYILKNNDKGINWPTRDFPNILFMMISSYSFIWIFIQLSKIIEKIKYLSNGFIYIGKNSLPIFIYHFVSFRMLFCVLYKLNLVPREQLYNLTPIYNSDLLFIITIVTGIVVPLIIDLIIKYFKNYIIIKLDCKNKKIICFILLIFLVFLCSFWLLSDRNFFIFDDFSHLYNSKFINMINLKNILPNQVYNSRPFGSVVMMFLYKLFGMNYKGHIIMLTIIHIINSILVFKLTEKVLNTKKLIVPFISMMFFALWPKSNMAYIWEAVIFDLVGATIVLLIINLYFRITEEKNIKNIIKKILLIILYYIGLRTKEMLILTPVVLLVWELITYIKNKKIKEIFNWKNIKYLLNKNIYLIILNILMFIYFVYTMILNSKSSITSDLNNPYYYQFSPIVIIKNIFNYFQLYFDFTVHSIQYIGSSMLAKMVIIFILLIIFGYIIKNMIKKRFESLFCLSAFLLTIAPVLPMKNMQHILYLYIPSIFLSIVLSKMYVELFSFITKNNKIKIIFVILFLLLINQNNAKIEFNKWWIDIAYNDKINYELLEEINSNYSEIDKVYVNNIPENKYHSFYYGPGHIINIAFDKKELKIYINKEIEENEKDKTLVIDYITKNYTIIGE